MRKSIFIKYFTIIISILLTGFVVLVSVLLINTKAQWKSEKEQLLSNNVQIVSEVAAEAILEGNDYTHQLENISVVIGQIINADVFIADTQGNTVICADAGQSCRHKSVTLSHRIMNVALLGNASFTGNLDGICESKSYTYSTPIIVSGNVVGVVFASASAQGESIVVINALKMLSLWFLIVFICAFFAVYIASSQMTRPLRQMADAARKMENGEFVQIPAVSRKDEIGLLVDSFNRMSKNLSQLEDMRRSFISSVSHELKTPMTTISGFIDGMLDGTIEKQDYPKYLEIVSNETKRLSRLVNSMLQMSRLENENMQLNLSSFNMTDLLVRVMLSFENKIESKNIEIKGLEDAEKIMLFADADLIYQVFYNLIENAIKFTPENGYIFVKVSEELKGEVEIVIQNSGEGLSSVELSRIFERFYKTDRSRSSDKTGIGFGLYIVKTIVGLHNGQIYAESVLNEFTKFTVKLPNEVQIPVKIEPVSEEKNDLKSKLSGIPKEEPDTVDAEYIE